MRFLLVLLTLTISSFSHADTVITTQIHDVDLGGQGEEPLVFLSTGQVVTVTEKSHVNQLKEAVTKKSWFDITIDEDRKIVEIKEIPVQLKFEQQPSPNKSMMEEPYSPSILKNLDQARSLFYEARTDAHKDSQCYNRAHVWTYEWRLKHNLYSSKVWLFFTRKFIRKYKFEWWFHVAPTVHVIADGEVKERVMDVKYARGPIKLKQWTDIFMRDSATCPVVETYSDHANYPETGSCFVMKSSMYYYQPIDLEQKEVMGYTRNRWLEPEVKHAYEEAFHVNF